MRIGYHPEFADDINRFAAGYREVSVPLADRLVFGSVEPSRSDPLLWLSRFGPVG